MDGVMHQRQRREDAAARVLGAISIVLSILIAGMWFTSDDVGIIDIAMPAAIFLWFGQRMLRNRPGLFD